MNKIITTILFIGLSALSFSQETLGTKTYTNTTTGLKFWTDSTMSEPRIQEDDELTEFALRYITKYEHTVNYTGLYEVWVLGNNRAKRMWGSTDLWEIIKKGLVVRNVNAKLNDGYFTEIDNESLYEKGYANYSVENDLIKVTLVKTDNFVYAFLCKNSMAHSHKDRYFTDFVIK